MSNSLQIEDRRPYLNIKTSSPILKLINNIMKSYYCACQTVCIIQNNYYILVM